MLYSTVIYITILVYLMDGRAFMPRVVSLGVLVQKLQGKLLRCIFSVISN